MYNITNGCDKLKEKVIIAALNNYEDNKDFESSLKEIERLAESVGAEVCGTLVQNNMKIDSKTYIGKGKAEELKEASENLNVDTIIFNNELTGSQQKNLEKIIKKNIIDRTQLILEILQIGLIHLFLKCRLSLQKQNICFLDLKDHSNHLIDKVEVLVQEAVEKL